MRAVSLLALLVSISVGSVACVAQDDSDVDPATGERAAVCAGVPLGPINASGRTDRGVEGLGALRDEVKLSREKFDQLKTEHSGNYRYQTTFTSWTGYGCTTELTVRDDIVVKRVQSRLSRSDSGTEVVKEREWVEGADTIGSHSGCHPAATLDAVYDECLAEALCSDPAKNLIYLSTDEQGVLLMCGVFPMNCQDDCYEGAQLDWVTFD